MRPDVKVSQSHEASSRFYLRKHVGRSETLCRRTDRIHLSVLAASHTSLQHHAMLHLMKFYLLDYCFVRGHKKDLTATLKCRRPNVAAENKVQLT